MAWTGVLLFLVIVAVLAVVVTVTFYNRFVTLANRCDESWSNVETELQRRHDLVPNLVATVQGYARHEKRLLTEIAKARSQAMRSLAAGDHAGGDEARLAGLLDKLLAVAEAYPDLKASKHFLELQDELAITEDRIQAARRFYNGNVRDQRDATRQFPGNLFARLFKPDLEVFFEAEAVHVPTVRMA